MFSVSSASSTCVGTGTIIKKTSVTAAPATKTGVVAAIRWPMLGRAGALVAEAIYAIVFLFNRYTNAITCATAA